MKERLFQEVFGAADVLGDSVSRVVTAAESRPFLGAETSSVVASTWVRTYIRHPPPSLINNVRITEQATPNYAGTYDVRSRSFEVNILSTEEV